MATVVISTTLWSNRNKTRKLGVMKPKDALTEEEKNKKYYEVEVEFYDEKDWFCKCKHKKFGTGYALYFQNGNVHISGAGVTEAIKKRGGIIGDPTTGAQTMSSKSKSKALICNGTVQNKITLRVSQSASSASAGTIDKGTKVIMSKINTTTGWCYVKPALGSLTPGAHLNAGYTGGYVQYKTKSTTYIKATSVTQGYASLSTINAKNPNNGGNTEDTGSNPDPTSTDDSSIAISDKFIPTDTSLTRDTIDYTAFTQDFKNYTDANAFVKSARGIHGMPYQFSSIVDPKIQDGDKVGLYGKLYSDRILSKMPLLVLSPGKPIYMPNYGDKDIKGNVLTNAVKMGLGKLDDLFDEITGEEGAGKFYSFQHDYEYFDYLKLMIQQLARYLDLSNKRIPSSSGNTPKISKVSWQRYQNNYINDAASDKFSVGFYIDSETQISESFNNSTAESQFASSINQVNDLSREIQFLMGGATGEEFKQLVDQNFNEAFSQIEQFTSKYVQVLPGLLTSRLKNTFNTIKIGGQLVFPEIWNDSDFSRNIDINIKLRTPDGDNFSWFMNIGIPLMHLLCFTIPKRLGDNGIQSPFLVRAYYKGFFNVNMGIITSLSISKGDKCKWNLQGLPTDIDVSFTIKDLYQSLSIESGSNFKKNTDQLDYIANLCGINVNKPDIIRGLVLNYERYVNAGYNILTGNNFLHISEAIDNYKLGMAEKYIR